MMNITLILDMVADSDSSKIMFGERVNGLSANDVRERARFAARCIRTANADAIVFLAANGPAFAVALFASAYAGVPFVPLNYRLGAEQLEALLANHPKALCIADTQYEETLRQFGQKSHSPAGLLSAAPDCDDNPVVVIDTETSRAAVLLYTSGTTATPKGVVLEHSNLMSYVLSTVEFESARHDEAALVTVPPYHIAAVASTLTNLYAGRRVVTLPDFTPDRWLETVRQEEITHAMVVPTMLARIMDAPGGNLSTPSLRFLSYGGARMPERVIRQALEEWPHVAFVNAYGLTETSSTIAVLGPEDHRLALASEDPVVQRRLSSVGQLVPGINMVIRDSNGCAVPAGVSGRIWVRGDQVSRSYAGIGSSVDADGFFDTRDEGYFDDDGYLYVMGRADDTIIRGGENISPTEIEDVLLRHPDVADAVVVGVPDDEWGQRIEAVVVSRNGAEPDPESIVAHARAVLRGAKTPTRIVIWPELPRTVTGKLLRRDVVKRLATDRNAQ